MHAYEQESLQEKKSRVVVANKASAARLALWATQPPLILQGLWRGRWRLDSPSLIEPPPSASQKALTPLPQDAGAKTHVSRVPADSRLDVVIRLLRRGGGGGAYQPTPKPPCRSAWAPPPSKAGHSACTGKWQKGAKQAAVQGGDTAVVRRQVDCTRSVTRNAARYWVRKKTAAMASRSNRRWFSARLSIARST